jgi:CheY-like chemotaxis protein
MAVTAGAGRRNMTESEYEKQTGLVLLVEDNSGIAEMVGEFLERRGYTVDFAGDGVSGLHLAVTNSYDVIVLDLMLPGMDGLDVCRKLRGEAKKSTRWKTNSLASMPAPTTTWSSRSSRVNWKRASVR